MLTNVLRAIEQVVDVPVRPFGLDVNEEAVCYTWSPQSDNGAVAVGRLEIRLVTRTVAKAESLRKSILNALVTIGDESKHGYKSCELNGGGSLWDDNTKFAHSIFYLYITTKSEVSYNG